MAQISEQHLNLKRRVWSWSERLKVTPTQVRVQHMTRKWASCSTKGWISLACDLVNQPRRFQDYVIVHELLHLRVPNHGKLWKSLMRIHLKLKDYESLEATTIKKEAEISK